MKRTLFGWLFNDDMRGWERGARLLLHAIGALAFTVPRLALALGAAARDATRGRAVVEQCAAADAPVDALDPADALDADATTATAQRARAPAPAGSRALSTFVCARSGAACAALQLLERASRRASVPFGEMWNGPLAAYDALVASDAELFGDDGLAEIDAALARARARAAARGDAAEAGAAACSAPPPPVAAPEPTRDFALVGEARLKALNAFDAMVSSRVCRARRPWSTRRPARAPSARRARGAGAKRRGGR